ncbi:hypothetical protein FH608_031125 [Nonomuraea phyllanthi]|uniref:Septum formation-related domain-containing protein n=1 Tax=Nonomuraea phyllanthi TaxID=2219224 RepID=A0A5C4VJB8_9ACTN|nr:hypothetical protein [Nonomuraea phyllanthi]KAB8191078.1 hypothetical protein FH608_031125 [Nonomuraea phyllanthi]
MVRTSLIAFCLAISLIGCAGDPAPAAFPEPEPAATPETPPEESAIPGAERFPATVLRPGDCIEPLPTTFDVTVVPCDVPHSAEFATMYILPEGPYPEAEMARLVEEGCTPRMRIKESRMDEVGVWGLGPGRDHWPRYRTVYCMAVPVDGQKLTGRVIK